MATTVIIPARNEEATIAKIVQTFQDHPETKDHVYIGVDGSTSDHTSKAAIGHGGFPVRTGVRGKGEVVLATLNVVGNLPGMLSERIILCDADYTDLTTDHITAILKPPRGMAIGIPDWPAVECPEHVINAWPRVSGFRCLPWALIPSDAHGYLLETQLNLRAIKFRIPFKFVPMPGLKSPFQWPLSPRRLAAAQADREWGERHGYL